MKLLNELIATLSAEQPNLTDTLMKTKVLLHRLGRKDLAEWVNLELNGYPDAVSVPDYRVADAHVKGVVGNAAYTYNDHPLPTFHLDQRVRNRFEKLEMRDSISVLEGLARNDKNGLSRPIPLELNRFLDKALTGGYKVQQARCDIGVGRLSQILT